jgi:predicted nucleic acid-binding protein
MKLKLLHKLVSKGIKLIDACIIYSIIHNNCKLWTLDKKMAKFLDKKYLYKPSGVNPT